MRDFCKDCFSVKGLKSWLTVWRRKRVRHRYRVLWDMLMMAFIWVVWIERNNRIFNHKATSILNLLDPILYFVNF